TGFSLNAVWFTSRQEGWAVGQSGTVLHTMNGGSLWVRDTTLHSGEDLLDVQFVTRDTGFVVGTLGVVCRTFDRGATWSRTFPTASALRSGACAGTRDGWAVGNGGIVLGTHDRGDIWSIVQPPVTSQTLHAVWRRSEARSWAVGDQGVAPRTFAGPDTT